MAKRTATLTPKQPSKSAKRAKSALRTEPLSSEALFTLGGDDATHALVEAEVLRRPSQRNRSPYVADIRVAGREAIWPRAFINREIPRASWCHSAPVGAASSDRGRMHTGKPALDTKGNLVGPDAVNPKYGTPKCEFHCQLAKLREAATSARTRRSAKRRP